MAELIPRPLVEIAPGGEILVKDKGRLPTGSFKARRLALASKRGPPTAERR